VSVDAVMDRARSATVDPLVVELGRRRQSLVDQMALGRLSPEAYQRMAGQIEEITHLLRIVKGQGQKGRP
jgi:hypothetical protein